MYVESTWPEIDYIRGIVIEYTICVVLMVITPTPHSVHKIYIILSYLVRVPLIIKIQSIIEKVILKVKL